MEVSSSCHGSLLCSWFFRGSVVISSPLFSLILQSNYFQPDGYKRSSYFDVGLAWGFLSAYVLRQGQWLVGFGTMSVLGYLFSF
jgi:hypothetical protein